jgi:hypothetical protein
VPHRERAARRRLERIRFRDTWPLRMWLLLVAMIVVALLAPKLSELHWQLHHPNPHKAHQR